jgi:hypothetical protein
MTYSRALRVVACIAGAAAAASSVSACSTSGSDTEVFGADGSIQGASSTGVPSGAGGNGAGAGGARSNGGNGGLPRSGGGASSVGGANAGGNPSSGGARNSGGNAGTAAGSGGNSSTGGALGTGGNQNTGGKNAGGSQNSGGVSSTGGASGTGGLPPIQGGTNGYATRFWDCCKPHCGWQSNVPSGTNPVTSCNQSNASLGSDYSQQSSCNGGGAYLCQGLAPWSVNNQVAYGYAATSSGDVCGRCFQLQFTGNSHNGGNDPGSQALLGKQMIVQAINIGSDVAGGQFDILTPGGGVGTFNACSTQWGVSASELGAQYGGFLSACQTGGGYAAAKSCVASRCSSVFGSRGLTELAAGCSWFVDWFQAADNPSLVYKEVACPQEITNKSGMVRH